MIDEPVNRTALEEVSIAAVGALYEKVDVKKPLCHQTDT
jgi:hypothetical protein